MAKLLIAIVALGIGLALGFLIGSTGTSDAVDVGGARHDAETARPMTPAPLAESTPRETTAPSSQPVAPERAAEPEAPPAPDPEAVPDGILRGGVVDAAGRPVPFARVSGDLESAAPDSPPKDPTQGDGGFSFDLLEFNKPAPFHVETIATRSGRFSLGGLVVGGQYFVRTQRDRELRADIGRDWTIDDRHVTAPADDLRLTYSQCVLEVELVDPQHDQHFAECAITASVAGADPWHEEGDSTAMFRLGVPPDRAVRIDVRARGFAPATSDAIVVTAAEGSKRIAITLVARGSGTARVLVRDDLGQPQRDVTIQDVTDPAHVAPAKIDWGRSAPDEGQFLLTELSPGMHSIVVRAPPDSSLVPARVQMQAIENAETAAAAVLRRGGRLRVTVSANSDTFIEARLMAGKDRVEGSFRDETTRQDVGDQLTRGERFLFEVGIEPGNYVLDWRRGTMGNFGRVAFRSLGRGPSGHIDVVIRAGEIADVLVKLD